MKYNSIHKFDDSDDAKEFIFAIIKAGFTRTGYAKDGGVIYSNGKHEMFICVS